MTTKEMHYDFKKKFNKIDSQQSRNFLIPEIDWTLNEAIELIVKMIVSPLNKPLTGLENNQKTIDSIRTLVVSPKTDPSASIEVVDNVVTLPTNYWHFLKARVVAKHPKCGERTLVFYPQQNDDEFEESVFNKSSYEWKSVNGTFFDGGVELYTDGTFTNQTFRLTYVRRPNYIHNAESFRSGSYKLPSGEVLTGTVNCELPLETHRSIVDIAVALASGEINTPDYQLKLQKLSLNKLI